MAQPELKRGLMLRNRIVLGLAPIFILLIAMGIYAVSLFAKLGGAIDVILRENFRSVLAAQNMKESAERMDSALFFTTGRRGTARTPNVRPKPADLPRKSEH